jgi:predicted PurR-regulated permease PerM
VNDEPAVEAPRVAAAQQQPLGDPPLSRVPGWLWRSGVTAWMLIGLLIVVVAVYLGLSQISTLVAPLVVAVVMGMLFYPLVDRLERVGLRRGLGASVILVSLAVIVMLSLYLAVRGIFDQADVIVDQVERGWEQIQILLTDLGVDLSEIDEIIGSIGSGASGGIGSLVTATVSSVGLFFVGVFIGTFLLYYLLKDWHVLTSWMADHMGLPRDLGGGLIEDATTSIRQYFYALTMTSIPVAIIIGLVMWALGLPLAFTVILVTFVTAYIPYLGAIVSGAFATLVALGSGGVTEAIIVLAAVLITQNLLQTLMLTRLSSATLHIHPIVNFGSTIIGATLAGILGATLSAPVVASVTAAKRRLASYRWGADPTGAAVPVAPEPVAPEPEAPGPDAANPPPGRSGDTRP